MLPETAVAAGGNGATPAGARGFRRARQESLGAVPARARRRGQRAQARRQGSREHAPVRGREVRAGPDRGEGLARARHRDFPERRGSKADVASLVEGQNATLRLLAKAFEKAQIEEINPRRRRLQPGTARGHDGAAAAMRRRTRCWR